jgi:hypothetical protein
MMMLIAYLLEISTSLDHLQIGINLGEMLMKYILLFDEDISNFGLIEIPLKCRKFT